MKHAGLRFVKNNKAKNDLHALVLFSILIVTIIGGFMFRSVCYSFAVIPETDNSTAITISIGGSFNPPLYKDKTPVFAADVQKIFQEADLSVISFSAPVVSVEYAQKEAFLPESIAGFLKDSSVNIVGLADHRVLAYGVAGLLQTMDFLAKHQVKPLGIGMNQEEALMPVYFTKDKVTVAILALNPNPPPGWGALQNRFGVAFGEPSALSEQLRKIKDKCDVLVVLVSFTRQQPEWEQQEFAEFLIDQGANMVVGTAASSLQKVDRYRNGLIFYNIGHIASPPNIISYNKESVILHIAITTEKQLEIMAVPIFTNHADVKIAKGPLVKSKIFARLGARSWRLDL